MRTPTPRGQARKSTLENGLRVVTLANPTARSISIGLLVDVGSASEPVHQAGISHLCEHLLFHGTSNRDSLEIARLMDGAGGRIGGFTTRDYTCYFAIVLADYATYAVDLLSDLILNPIFPEDALQREKDIVLCEMDGAGDSPQAACHDLVKRLAWPGDPLGQSIRGKAESLRDLQREDLIYFLHSHYLPSQMVIAAAGNLDHADFEAHVRDGFWRLLGSSSAPRNLPAATFGGGTRLLHHGGSQAYFALAFEASRFGDGDRYCMHAVTQILGGGLSSRLFRVLREELGLVFDVSASYDAYRDGGLLIIEGSTGPEHLLEVLSRVLDLVTGVATWTEPIEVEELVRAKIQLRSQILLAGEDSHSVMSRIATQELYFGEFESEKEMLRQIDSLTLDSMKDCLNETFCRAVDKPALAVVAPEFPELYSHETLDLFLHGRLSEITEPTEARDEAAFVDVTC